MSSRCGFVESAIFKTCLMAQRVDHFIPEDFTCTQQFQFPHYHHTQPSTNLARQDEMQHTDLLRRLFGGFVLRPNSVVVRTRTGRGMFRMKKTLASLPLALAMTKLVQYDSSNNRFGWNGFRSVILGRFVEWTVGRGRVAGCGLRKGLKSK